MKPANKFLNIINEISTRIKITSFKDKYTATYERKDGKVMNVMGSFKTREQAEEKAQKAMEMADEEHAKKMVANAEHDAWMKSRAERNKKSMDKHGRVDYSDKEIYGDEKPMPKKYKDKFL